jgi:molecular chaperone DnaK
LVLWDHEKREEYVFPMIPKRTPIPAARKDAFGASKRQALSATVRVVEGESSQPAECHLLGTCKIDFPQVMQRGSPIEITYTYTRNQVLEVTIEAFNCVNRVQIARGSGMSEAELATASAELAKINVS